MLLILLLIYVADFGAAGEKCLVAKKHTRNPIIIIIIIIIFLWPKTFKLEEPTPYIWTGAQIQLSFVAVQVDDFVADFVDEFVADFVVEFAADFVVDFVTDVGAAGENFQSQKRTQGIP